ncbi:uncharacterized protein LOC114298039 [Camellia sinensis]|uniref:uncharacterized protein LOC114298039 n=1 Tax=Camellia sinensis TaxID=4442 RepID=UPI00103655B3|nr:uncharacterized protein LOC114298039 [Camellia sinensis]
MASSFSSESGHSRTNALRLSYCGERSLMKTLMASGNMDKRFYGCARYGVDVTCGYFEWVDPPMCQHGKEVLPKMVAKMNRLEKELATSRRREKMFCKALFGTWVFFFIITMFWLKLLGGKKNGLLLGHRVREMKNTMNMENEE